MPAPINGHALDLDALGARVANMSTSGRWAGATAEHVVAAYAIMHRSLYGSDCDELRDPKSAGKAVKDAERVIAELGGHSAAVDYLRWLAAREKGAKSKRRLTPALALSTTVLGDYHAAKNHGAAEPIDAPNEPPTRRYRLLNYADLLAEAGNERTGLLLDGVPLLPSAGIVTVYGPAHAGKTTVLAAIAVACSAGVPILGGTPERGPVVWIHLEHAVSELLQHIQRAAEGLGVDLDQYPVHVLRPNKGSSRWTLDDPTCIAETNEMLDEIGAARVIVDPFRRASDADENRSNEVSMAYAHASQLTDDGKRLVAITHHTGHSGHARGSTDFIAASDASIKVTPLANDVVKLEAVAHTRAPFPMHIRIEREPLSVRFEVTDKPNPPAKSTSVEARQRAALVAKLTELGPTSHNILLEATGGNAKAARTAIKELVAEGAVLVTPGPRSSKVYSLPTTEQETAHVAAP
jgi:hypothetical protein